MTSAVFVMFYLFLKPDGGYITDETIKGNSLNMCIYLHLISSEISLKLQQRGKRYQSTRIKILGVKTIAKWELLTQFWKLESECKESNNVKYLRGNASSKQVNSLSLTLTFTSLLKDMIKYTVEQPNEEICRAKPGRVQSTGASMPVELWCVILLLWMCLSTWKLWAVLGF